MLKNMLYRKIMVASTLLLVIFILYLIPTNNHVSIEETLEYVYPNDLAVIYLLDTNNYVSRTVISVNNQDSVSKSRDLIEGLTIGGKKQEKIPNGFKSLLPPNTRILNVELQDNILKLNFSQEFNDISKEYEEKMIEAITYTLTSLEGIDKISIMVEGEKLTNLPHSKKKLPEYLDKNYGINKEYELTTLNNINSYTIYYVASYNDETYYTPVTKYINDEEKDRVKIIIEELSNSLVYESNLMTYLDTNVKLLDYEIIDNKIKLNFNDLILSNVTNNVILEEVMYTIGLSICDELSLQEVTFLANNKEISTFFLNGLD